MDTVTLTYDGQDVALAGRERFWLAAHIDALPDGHPTKRFITFMALLARDVLTGELPGSYSDHRARTLRAPRACRNRRYRARRRPSDRELPRRPPPTRHARATTRLVAQLERCGHTVTLPEAAA